MSNLEKNILKTITYFDIFEHPLTLLELHKWLINSDFVETRHASSLQNLKNNLKNIPEIQQKNGFYFLKGQKKHVQTRLKRYLIAEKKFKKRKKIIQLLAAMPHVKMLAICNSLSYSNARDASDIDLFIITDPKHIWTARLFATSLVKLLGLRPAKNKTKNTICLSFFTAENNLDFEKLRCLNNDIYLKYWITKLMPIYDEGDYLKKFIQANNWVKKDIPNWLPFNTIDRRMIELTPAEKLIKKFLGLFSFDSLYKKIQLKALSDDLKELKNKDTRVIINDSMLKLYPLDRRKHYFELWQEKIKTLNVET